MKTGIIALIVLALVVVGYGLLRPHGQPVATPTPSPTPTISSIPTQTPGRTATPVPSTSLSPTVTPSSTPTQTPTPTSTPTESLSPTPSPTTTPAPTPQTYTILMQNHVFVPNTLTVNKGDFVVFRAVDAFYSIVVGGARSSGRLQSGQSWTLNSGDFLSGTYQIRAATDYPSISGTLIIQ